MKIALIHDHLAQAGGAEKVLESLAKIFPQATIYTLLYDKKNLDPFFLDRKIESSIIQRLPGGVKHYKWYLVFMPMAVEFFDLRDFDLVISDASAFAKGVITTTNTSHICYCHTPTRYLWSDAHQYLNELKYNKWFKKIISLSLGSLRRWDYLAAQRVDYFIANSKAVQKRISKFYRRDSEIIYPPVNLENFYLSDLAKQTKQERYFLAGCRLAPYKRIDLLVESFKELGPDYRLKIFGDGQDEKRLKKLAKDSGNIEFLGRVSEEEKAKLYSNALAFINPQEEDFGITAIESMASGRPVIAYQKGGALETVEAGLSGLFFAEQNVNSLTQVLRDFVEGIDSGTKVWDPALIRSQAEKFSEERFSLEILDFVRSKLLLDNPTSNLIQKIEDKISELKNKNNL